ncbi:carbamoyltransferase HypF [Roseiconus lacunae]|uniref:carbamoyltransferase HypF n=1 Tax=Roseiconus lacunae TaxID=2605694 RepID=UPI0030921E5F|nr:carbamoyltransferase HypF [Stieleria sp. HD01]
MRGLVQGQGVRPTIACLATQQCLAGTICNSSNGVEISASGSASELDRFQDKLRQAFPHVEFSSEPAEHAEIGDFRIIDSHGSDRLHTAVPLDTVTCPECIEEARSISDRRFGYPFITCARCGPRYSISRSMPFDRGATTMDRFPMCPRCEAEYRDPLDRRFHAQTICCPDCGPQCWMTDQRGKRVAEASNAIKVIAERIIGGQIVAIKGNGGYQLVCDATNDEAVGNLRTRKARPSKPLPVMVDNVDAARRFAHVSDTEQAILQSSAGPIVLLRTFGGAKLSPSLSPNLNTIGVMLPTTSLHLMLVNRVGRPLVVTSGNSHGSPIVYQNEVAQQELAFIADVFLHHDREITHPIDDSVVQCIGDRVMTIRAARGIAPMTFAIPTGSPAIATGGHQKVAFAIHTGNALVLGPHIGDMNHESSRFRFVENVSSLSSLHQVDPSCAVHDQHPDYFTTHWSEQNNVRRSDVQHHHAHVAAAMLEHDLVDRTVLGMSFDGTGYGDDGTIWGGEVLLASAVEYRRLAHVRPFNLPGGEAAIRQPWRIAKSLCSQVGTPIESVLQYAIEHGPSTSSMGRLFDGVASLVLGIESVDNEGEAAMRLEAVCDGEEPAAYRFEFTDSIHFGSPAKPGEKGAIMSKAECPPSQLDWRPIVRDILTDREKVSPGRIAMKFHRAVANLICDLSAQNEEIPCVLCGGVFQNRVILELIQQAARERGLDIRLPGRIPVHDGGLSVGQLVIAQSRQQRSRQPCV